MLLLCATASTEAKSNRKTYILRLDMMTHASKSVSVERASGDRPVFASVSVLVDAALKIMPRRFAFSTIADALHLLDCYFARPHMVFQLVSCR